MSRTDRYRQQHTQIMRVATDLGAQLDVARLTADGAEARRLLSDLSGKIIVHLAAEDAVLYPQMFNCQDSAAQTTAKRFASEMSRIAEAFKAYSVRWAAVSQIQSAPEKFVAETRTMIKTLGERMRRENTELYPLADAL